MAKKAIEVIIPSSPADREAIFKVVKEISNSKTRVESEREYQREAIKELSKKYDVPASVLAQTVNDYHKDTFDTKVENMGTYEDFYTAIIPE